MSLPSSFFLSTIPSAAAGRAIRSAGFALLSVALCLGQAQAAVLHSQDFSTAPADLNSGNWNSNITDGAVPEPSVWSTAGGFAGVTNVGSGIRQGNAQYSFDATELAGFGSLYDTDTGTIGGGNAAGTLYLRFDIQVLHPTPDGPLGDHFGVLQLFRGSTSNRGVLDNFSAGGASAMQLGKNWGFWAYSYAVHGNAVGDLNSTGEPEAATYAHVDTQWHTIVARIDYNAAAADAATVWFDPDFSLSEPAQDPAITTILAEGAGNLSFNTFVLRGGNNGLSANFDGIVFATESTEVGFAVVPEPATWLLALGALGACSIAKVRTKRKGAHVV